MFDLNPCLDVLPVISVPLSENAVCISVQMKWGDVHVRVGTQTPFYNGKPT